MNTKFKITATVIAVAAVSLACYDLFVAAFWGVKAGATISWVTFTLSKEYPIIPFGAGLLCGHLFGSMPGVTTGVTATNDAR